MDNYDKFNEEINKNISPPVNNNDNPLLISVTDPDDSRNLHNAVNSVNEDSLVNRPSDFISLGNKKENIMDRLRKNKHNSFDDKKKVTSFDFILIGIFCIALLGLIGYLISYFITPKIEILYTDSEIEKPLIDENLYEIIRLLNGIEVALISNRNLTTCSAAVVVNSGFRSLPKMNGVPHLTEHMLFLGNEKYQNKSHLIDLISRYFGNINGKTEDFETSFFFDLGKDGFKLGLDSFANIFKNPIVDKVTMIEEIKNLQAEYIKYSYDNQYCEKHLIQNIIYSSSFEQNQEILPEGNQETLSKDYESLRGKVIEYFNAYFTGKNLKIAIMSHESLSTMRGLAIKHFSSIPKEGIKPTAQEMLHDTLHINTGRIIAFKGKGTISYMDIIFYVKPTNNLDDISFNIGYFKYIQYLLRSTEKGSLFKVLNEENKVIQLSTHTSVLDNSIMSFSIRIDLLSKTSDQLLEIIYKVYNYIRIIRENEVEMEKYSELEKIFEKEMKFHEQSEANSDFTESTAKKLFRVGKNGLSFFKYDIFMPKYNKDKIKDIFEQLIPENSAIILSFTDSYELNVKNFTLVSNPEKLFAMKQLTHFYSLSYEWCNIIPSQLQFLKNMNVYDDKLKIPKKPNQFLTKLEHLVEPSSPDEGNSTILAETLIGNTTSHISLFYKLDRSLRLPKFHLTINLINPLFRVKDDVNYTIYMLYTTYLTHAINLLFCEAVSSGSSLEITRNENGIFIHITSFTDLFDTVNDLAYKAIFSTDLSKETYIFYKELLKNELSNYSFEQPFSKAKQYFKMIIKNSLINIYEYQFEDDSELIDKSLNTIPNQMISILYYGNIQKDKVNEIYTKYLKENIDEKSTSIESHYDVANKIDFFPFIKNTKELPQYSIVYQKSKIVAQTATSNYFYVGYSTTDNDILSDIISLVWEEKFFNELRNKKGIGFHVYSRKEYYSGKIYFNFVVQSTYGNQGGYNEINMNQELDEVIGGEVKAAIDNLSDDYLYNLKYNILLKKNKKDISLSSKAKNMMNKVIYRLEDDPPIHETVIDKNLMKKYTVNIVQDFFYKIFYNNVHKLSIQIYYDNGTPYIRNKEKYYLKQDLICQPTDNLYFLFPEKDK